MTSQERRWRRGIWLLLVAMVAASVMGAHAWQTKLRSQDRAAFATRASDLALTVQANLTRDSDFVAYLRGLVETTPGADNARFAQWITAVDPAQRYPGGIGYNFWQSVPAAQLGAFEALLIADPPNGVPIVDYRVTPSGLRSRYCLTRFNDTLSGPDSAGVLPIGTDVCAPGNIIGAALSPDGGDGSQFVVTTAPGGSIGVVAPAYAAGVTPATVAGLHSAFIGWMGGTFAAAGALPGAASRHGLRIEVAFHNAGSAPTLVAASGVAPRGYVLTERLAFDADGPWTVTIEGDATGPGTSWGQAGLVLAIGLVVSAMAFGLLQLLARGRRRALRVVAERTGQLHQEALHDSLTGLPNRALIQDRIQQMLARRRNHFSAAVLFIDLDGFKAVNDTYGHAAGDVVLRTVAARLTATLRARDTAGRLGGDEFIVLVEGTDAGPELVAERLLAVLREPIVIDAEHDISAAVGASIGIAVAVADVDADPAQDLIRDADIALYKAKGAGRNRYAFFAPTMRTAAHDRFVRTNELRSALGAGELFLAYQPTFRLRDMTVTGAEALIRWRHPSGVVLAPDDFIPLAEEAGLMIPIGRWVLETACAEAMTWPRSTRRPDGQPAVGVTVNLSGCQLDSDGLVDDVRAALTRSGLHPSLLTLDIAETALRRDTASGLRRLRALKALGTRVAIDHFGSYSSLTYLRQFPADAVKIDRSFISAMDDSPESAVIVRTLIELGQALGIETLAAGIEERTQLERLQSQDCDSGQGFIFARPLSPEALQRLIGTVTGARPSPSATSAPGPPGR